MTFLPLVSSNLSPRRALRRVKQFARLSALAGAALLPAVWRLSSSIAEEKGTLPGIANLLLLLANLGLSYRAFLDGARDPILALSDEAYGEGFDRTFKRLTHSIAFFFAATMIFLLADHIAGQGEEIATLTILQKTCGHEIFLEAAIFLLLKNALFFRIFYRFTHRTKARLAGENLAFVLLASAGYWTTFVLILLPFARRGELLRTPLLLALGLFALLLLLYDLTLRRRATIVNLRRNRARLVGVFCLIFLLCVVTALRGQHYYLEPYIASLPHIGHATLPIEYDEARGVYSITAASDFRILHLTDIHLGGSLFSLRKDRLALDACLAEIRATDPDLVIVTGDICLPLGLLSFSFDNAAPVYEFAAFMRNLCIPWAFTYGNHDTEAVASTGRAGLDAIFRSLSYKTSGCLLYPYVQPAVTGRNNQLLEIRNEDGSLRQALFLFDSNDYIDGDIARYDYIHDDQVDWYESEVLRLSEREGRTIPSLAFFHIPLPEYRTAFDLYEAGSTAVTYFFGSNEERVAQKVCCSEHPCALFDRIVALGSTTGTFCGHDHYNNISLRYRGVRLTYGMSIDYLAMPGISRDTAQRGAELITLLEDGSWTLRRIPLLSLLDD